MINSGNFQEKIHRGVSGGIFTGSAGDLLISSQIPVIPLNKYQHIKLCNLIQHVQSIIPEIPPPDNAVLLTYLRNNAAKGAYRVTNIGRLIKHVLCGFNLNQLECPAFAAYVGRIAQHLDNNIFFAFYHASGLQSG